MRPFYFVTATCLSLALLGTLAYKETTPGYLSPQPSAQALASPMKPMVVDPSWIKSGKPVFMAAETMNAPAARMSAGLWSCDGPTVFEWTFAADETVHILEGEVEIDYLGKHFVLKAGDTAYFRSHTQATWTVKQRVYKSYVLYHTGTLGRWVRALKGA